MEFYGNGLRFQKKAGQKREAAEAKLKEIEVMRALQWLENKELLKIHTEKVKMVSLDIDGQRYKKEDQKKF